MSHKTQFKIYRDHKEIGDYSAEEMIQLRLNGALKETDFYWHQGMDDRAPMIEGGMWEHYSLFHQPKDPKFFQFVYLLHGVLMTALVWVTPVYLAFNSGQRLTPFSPLFLDELELLCFLNAAVLLVDWLLAILVRILRGKEFFRRIYKCESWIGFFFSSLLFFLVSSIIYIASACFFDFIGRKNFFNGAGYDGGDIYRR
jgi:hypothetical protein